MKTALRILFVLLYFSAVHAGLEDYFKKPTEKSCSHSLPNIDFIYVLNLDQRPEKFALCLEQLAPYQIIPYRFSAVNGWELTLETINDVGIKYDFWMTSGKWGTCYPVDGEGLAVHEIVQVPEKNYFAHCMSRGAIGIVLSHLSILQDAYDSNYETIWVMEDDIEVIRDPAILPGLIDELDRLVGKEGWDILFTDPDTKSQQGNYVPCTAYAWRPNFSPANPDRFVQKTNISESLRKVGARYGAYSMIVRRSGMKKLLQFFKNYKIFLPFDMDYTVLNDIRLFTTTYDVVSTLPQALSDNGEPNYKHKASNGEY
jgi:GR25 family glycosyltransferase involved in LPS biosynthesis